jgi:hypothetical protein
MNIAKFADVMASKDPDAVGHLIQSLNIKKSKVLQRILLLACRLGNLEAVKYLVETVRVHPHYRTLIDAADHLDVVKYLVGLGVDICAEKYSSIRRSSGEVTNYLIEHMNNANDIYVLVWAIKRRNMSAVQTFFDHKKGRFSAYALRCAAETGSLPIVKYLSEMTGDPDCTRAFIAAAAKGRLPVVKYFLGISDKLDVPYVIIVAAKRGHFNIVRYLVRSGNYGVGADLDRAACAAHIYGHFEIVGYLQSKGASLARYYGR